MIVWIVAAVYNIPMLVIFDTVSTAIGEIYINENR